MAGISWIKIETTLPRKPVVLTLRRLLKKTQNEVVGMLVSLLCWADGVTEDGTLRGLTVDDLDIIVDCEGFGDALLQAGWLTQGEELSFSEWDRHNGKCAKRRAEKQRSESMARACGKRGQIVDKNVHAQDTEIPRSVPLDKIREDIYITPQPPLGAIEVNYDSPENFVTHGGDEVKPHVATEDKGPLPYAEAFAKFVEDYPKPARGVVALARLQAKWRRAIEEDGYTGDEMLRALDAAMMSPSWMDSNYEKAPQIEKWFDQNAAKRFLPRGYMSRKKGVLTGQKSVSSGGDKEDYPDLTEDDLNGIYD